MLLEKTLSSSAPMYTWQWAANASQLEFDTHFSINGERLMKQLTNECSESSFKPPINYVLEKIGKLSFKDRDSVTVIRKFFKKVIVWESGDHWHVEQLLGIYLRAICFDQDKLMKTTLYLMHSKMASLVHSSQHSIQTDEEKQLMCACEEGNEKLFYQLINMQGISLNTSDPMGMTPLHVACLKGRTSFVDALLSSGKVNINKVDLKGSTPLMYAIFWNHPGCRNLLIKHKANLELQDSDGVRALHVACGVGDFFALKMLKEAGADLHCKTKEGFNGTYLAAVAGHLEVLDFLVENDVFVSATTKLLLARAKGSIDAIGSLIVYEDFTKIPGNELRLALECAYDLNHLELFKAVYNPLFINSHLYLLHAAADDRPEFVSFLKENGADINHKTEGEPMLISCCSKGDIEAVSGLLKYGADVHAREDQTGITALMMAAFCGFKDIANILLHEGAKLDLVDQDGETALFFALNEGQFKMAEYLLDRGADVTIMNHLGLTIIDLAARCQIPASLMQKIEERQPNTSDEG